MKILRLELDGYRSFRKFALDLATDLTVIVGENNVGKSSLLVGLETLRQMAFGGRLQGEDWSHGAEGSSVSMSFRCLLETHDILRLGNAIELTPSKFKEEVGTILTVISQWPTPGVEPRMSIGFAKSIERPTAAVAIEKPTAIVAISPVERSRAETREVKVFGKQMYDEAWGMIRESLVIFPEFRTRPQRGASGALVSPDGTEVASVLMNLKNGSRGQRLRWRKIQKDFGDLFPGLTIDVMKERVGSGGEEEKAPNVITVGKEGAESETTHERIGLGIADILVLLAHTVASSGKVIAIDEPELHLHPHSQRLLARLLKVSSSDNQILLTTHSPQFVDLGDVDRIVLIREKVGKSELNRIAPGFFSPEDRVRLARLSSEDREFLFSRRVLLVEGESEYGSMPGFSRKAGRELDVYGVSIMNYGGSYFGLYLRLVRAFGFPSIVMCDRDALMEIQETVKVGSRDVRTCRVFHELVKAGIFKEPHLNFLTAAESEIQSTTEGGVSTYDVKLFLKLRDIASSYGVRVLSADFEGVLRSAGLGNILDEGRKRYGKSKVLQGRYVAETARQTPPELANIIGEITRL